MPTQQEIAAHLDISERRLRDVLKSLNLDHREVTLDDIRIAYVRDLRAKAAGHIADGDFDLVKERVLTERVDRELKMYALAEKKGVLVNKEQLMPELQTAFSAVRASLMGMAVDIKSVMDVQYGTDMDLEIIESRVFDALDNLSRYQPGD